MYLARIESGNSNIYQVDTYDIERAWAFTPRVGAQSDDRPIHERAQSMLCSPGYAAIAKTSARAKELALTVQVDCVDRNVNKKLKLK